MIVAMCNGCNHFFRGKIHRLVLDGRDESHYCNLCMAAWKAWERERRTKGAKPYRPGFWLILTEHFRIWLMRRVMRQVPDGAVEAPKSGEGLPEPKMPTLRELRGMGDAPF